MSCRVYPKKWCISQVLQYHVSPTAAPEIENTTRPINTADSPSSAPTAMTCGVKIPDGGSRGVPLLPFGLALDFELWRCLGDGGAWRVLRTLVGEVEEMTNPICFNLSKSAFAMSVRGNGLPLNVELIDGSLEVFLLPGRYTVKREGDYSISCILLYPLLLQGSPAVESEPWTSEVVRVA